VRVARFADLTEAQVVASALEAADIPVLVENSQIGQTDFALQFALGGFAIMVPEERSSEAAAFIRDHRANNPTAAEDNEAAAPEVEDPGEETWAEGRARRRWPTTRWIVVLVFFGPGLLLLIYLMVTLLLRMIGAVFDG
jgi:hypothetical protein